ncbi:MAG: hypothetical protein ACOYMA_20140 [Bacteroidia bacterium]
MKTKEQNKMNEEKRNEESKDLLETLFPNYLEFVRLTKSYLYLTYYDKHLMLIDYVNFYNFEEEYDVQNENVLSVLSETVNHIFGLLCRIYNLKMIKNKRKETKEWDSIYQELKKLGMTVILGLPIDNWLNEYVITEESKFINSLINSMGYKIPTTGKLIEYKNCNPGLSEEKLEYLNKQIIR